MLAKLVHPALSAASYVLGNSENAVCEQAAGFRGCLAPRSSAMIWVTLCSFPFKAPRGHLGHGDSG